MISLHFGGRAFKVIRCLLLSLAVIVTIFTLGYLTGIYYLMDKQLYTTYPYPLSLVSIHVDRWQKINMKILEIEMKFEEISTNFRELKELYYSETASDSVIDLRAS
ncbi:Hypothetical protein CINCED_3A011984 [Cinara cedri]|uniref:Uncharacterized protein n=1 Tax=Cinara cedri TaxID=506608 RepID=A0A5E4MK53_9HEMI|nr:Hypothetical protein CINCED_3A011984 [Cinara cedri]